MGTEAWPYDIYRIQVAGRSAKIAASVHEMLKSDPFLLKGYL